MAGVGSRFLALAIDTLIQIAVALAAILTFAVLAATGIVSGIGRSSVWAIAAVSFIFFLLFFGYFALFEIFWNGQTPGKRMIGIRVVSESGRPLTIAEAIGRNLLRIVDQLPGFYGIGIIVALLNSRNRRLGDLLAGSIVVRESALASIRPDWQAAPASSAPSLGAGALSQEQLGLIEAFLYRRADLAPDVRSRMAAHILDQLKPHLPFMPDAGVSPESTLESLASERRS